MLNRFDCSSTQASWVLDKFHTMLMAVEARVTCQNLDRQMTIILVAYGVSREEVGGNNLGIAPVWEVVHSVFHFGIQLERNIALILDYRTG